MRAAFAALGLMCMAVSACASVGDQLEVTAPTTSTVRPPVVAGEQAAAPATTATDRTARTASVVETTAVSVPLTPSTGPTTTLVQAQPTSTVVTQPRPPSPPRVTTPPTVRPAPAPTSTLARTPIPIGNAPVAQSASSGPLVTGSPGLDRKAVAIKIDNHPSAAPQAGINEADIVFEVLVESISRFVAVFQSQDVAEVGPVRSARGSDLGLLTQFDRPLYGWSGGNVGVQDAVASSELIDAGAYILPSAYTRSSSRRAPHNLFTSTSSLRAVASGPAPRAAFSYRSPGVVPAAAVPSGGVSYTIGATRPTFHWSAVHGRWLRFNGTRAHLDTGGVQISPTNVLVLETAYQPSSMDARSPEAVSEGSGRAWLFAEGHVVEGWWFRANRWTSYVLADNTSAPMELVAGRTFVALVPAGSAVSLIAPG